MKGGLHNPRPVDNVPVDNQLQHGVTSNWAHDHTADLDAHTRNLREVLRTGQYHATRWSTADQKFILVANRLYAVPLIVVRALTIDRIALQVTTLDDDKNARLGIYSNGTNLYPGALLLDAGVVSVASTGVKAATIDQALAKGFYWLVVLTDGAPAIFASHGNYSTYSPLGMSTSNFGIATGGWYVAQAYGALPDPFTAAGAFHEVSAPVLAVRISSLD